MTPEDKAIEDAIDEEAMQLMHAKTPDKRAAHYQRLLKLRAKRTKQRVEEMEEQRMREAKAGLK